MNPPICFEENATLISLSPSNCKQKGRHITYIRYVQSPEVKQTMIVEKERFNQRIHATGGHFTGGGLVLRH